MIRISDDKIQEYEIKHSEIVRKTAAECTVLLKKDGTFPLGKPCDIALYGNGARHTIKGGTGSGDVNIRQFFNIEEAMTRAGFHITSKEWLDGYDKVMYEAKKAFYGALKEQAKIAGIPVTMLAIGKVVPEPDYELKVNASGTTAIYCLARNSGEGGDRVAAKGDIRLTETEIRDILEMNEKYEKFMLVLNTGGMVDLTPVKEVKNILILGQLGTPTSDILADLILGKSYPSGKLTMTWADIDLYPSTKNFGDMDDTLYNEGIYVGYRYFDKANVPVLYPFGYGLSYTDFEIKRKEIRVQGRTAAVNCLIRNTGSYAGKESIQVYISKPEKKWEMPVKELAAFGKTKELLPGEEVNLSITFDLECMKSYDEAAAAYVIPAGEYEVLAGVNSSCAEVIGRLVISEEIVTDELKNICINREDTDRLEEIQVKTNARAENTEKVDIIYIEKSVFDSYKPIYRKRKNYITDKQEKIDWAEVKAGRKSVEEFAAGLDNQELAYICCGSNVDLTDMGSIIGASSVKVAGAAGESTRKLIESHHLDSIVLCDGPAGVRVTPVYTLEDEKVKSLGMSFGEEMMEFLDQEDIEQMKQMMQIKNQKDEREEQKYYQYCTAIPIGTDIAQSFNTALAAEYGDIVGEEMEMFGIQLWLAPALNIMRSPLCGRNFEYYSEDPVVGGEMAAAIAISVQKHKNCGVTIKHFACNNQETNRYGSDSIVSERALREIYLKGFEICVKKASPKAVMSSYNLINGEHSANNQDILSDVLRDEWGFKGIVMTDWFTSTNMMNTPGGKHQNASAAGCIKAGNNLIMPGLATDLDDINHALTDKDHPYAITRYDLMDAAIPVLYTILENSR